MLNLASMQATRIILFFLLIVLVAACQQVAPTPSSEPDPRPDPAILAQDLAMLDYADDDRDPQRRLAALRLGLARHAGAVDALTGHLGTDPDPQVRAWCAWALGQTKNPASLAPLLEAAKSPDARVRREAIAALGELGASEAREALSGIATEAGGADSALALRALARLTGASLSTLPKAAYLDRGVAPASKEGRTWYVDATAGSDENDGTQQRPLRTLGNAVARLRRGHGDVVCATSGDRDRPFRELVVIGPDQAGIAGAPTVLKRWPGRPAPRIVGSEPIAHQPKEDPPFSAAVGSRVFGVYLVSQKETRFLEAADAVDTMKRGSFFYDDAQKLLLVLPPEKGFSNARIEAVVRPDAIRVENADHVIIQGVVAAYAQDTGIDFAGSYHGAVLDSKVHDCDRHGIFFYYSPFGTVGRCEVWGCRFQGISVRSSPRTVVTGAHAHDNLTDGILFLFDTDDAVVSGSRIERNGRGIAFTTGSNRGRVVGTEFLENGRDFVCDDQSDASLLPGPER